MSPFTPRRAVTPHVGFTFVTRLAIHCHGGPGQVYIDGAAKTPIDANNIGTTFQSKFSSLLMKLTPDATVVLMCCMSGQAQPGTDLVIAFSNALPGRTIAAFETIGFAPGGTVQGRPAASCSEPGMRTTGGLWGSATKGLNDPKYFKDWNDLNALPWASETGKFVKRALNGKIL